MWILKKEDYDAREVVGKVICHKVGFGLIKLIKDGLITGCLGTLATL